MKCIIRYVCDICDHQYLCREDAQACESQGRAPDYPKGLIFNLTLWRDRTDVAFPAIVVGSDPCHDDPHTRRLIVLTLERPHEGYRALLGPTALGPMRLGPKHAIDATGADFLTMMDRIRRYPIVAERIGATPTRWDGEATVPIPRGITT